MIARINLTSVSQIARVTAGRHLHVTLARSAARGGSVGRTLTHVAEQLSAGTDAFDVDLTGANRSDLSSLVRCLDSAVITADGGASDSLRLAAAVVEQVDREANPDATPLRNI